MNYLVETLKFIESEEMRKYLRKSRKRMSRYTCAKVVSCAPASLESKIPVLELIAEQTEHTSEWDCYDPAILAKEAHVALEERVNNVLGTVFMLVEWSLYHERESYRLFTTFDAAMRYIKETEKMCDNPNRCNHVSYTLKKWIPGEDGVMEDYFYWILNYSGEIWYFDYGEIRIRPEGYEEFFDYIGAGVNLPVPFKPGDIITADCRPFAEERHILIISIGDNRDCCAVQCLYILPNGKIFISAFKHNSFLHYKEISHVSGLYRATRYSGELAESEAPLKLISSAIKSNPKRTKEIYEYVHKYSTSDDDEYYTGVKWELVKNEFGL